MSIDKVNASVPVPQNWRSVVSVISSLVVTLYGPTTGGHIDTAVQAVVLAGSSLVLGLERLATSIETSKTKVVNNGMVGS